MARFIRKVGQATQKYLFELQIHEVVLRVPYEVQVSATFKCGAKRQESKITPIINATNPIANFQNEKLTLLSSLIKDKTTNELQERHAYIIITLRKDDKEKNVGVLKLNLVEYIDGVNNCTLTLEKCPDKGATLTFSIKTTVIQNMSGGSETQSMMSVDNMSVDSPPGSEFDYDELEKPSNKANERIQRLSRIAVKTDAITAMNKRPTVLTAKEAGLEREEASSKLPTIVEQKESKSVFKILPKPPIKEIKEEKEQEESKVDTPIQPSPNIVNRMKVQVAQINQTKDQQAKISQLEESIVQQTEHFQTQVTQIILRRDQLQQQVNKSEAERIQIEQERDKLKICLKQSEILVKEYKEKDNKATKELFDLKCASDTHNKTYQQKLDTLSNELQSKIEQLEEDKKQLESALSIQKQSGKEMLNKIQFLQKEHLPQSKSSQESQIYLLKTQNQQFESENSSMKEQIKELTEVTLAGNKLDLQQKTFKIKELQDKISVQNQQISQQKTEKIQDELQFQQLKDQISALTRQLQNAQENNQQEAKSLQKIVQEKDKKIAQYERKFQDFEQNKMDQLDEFNEKTKQQKNIFDYQLADQRKQIQTLEQQLQTSKSPLKIEHHDSDKEVSDLKLKLQQQKADAQDAVLILKEEIKELRKINPNSQLPKQGQESREITKFQVEIEYLKKQIFLQESKLKYQETSKEIIDSKDRSSLEQQVKSAIESRNKIEEDYEKLHSMYLQTEQSLVDAKMMWASLDMECDELTILQKRKNDQIKHYQSRMTKLEIDLAHARNQLQTPNESNEKSPTRKSKLTQILSVFSSKK